MVNQTHRIAAVCMPTTLQHLRLFHQSAVSCCTPEVRFGVWRSRRITSVLSSVLVRLRFMTFNGLHEVRGPCAGVRHSHGKIRTVNRPHLVHDAQEGRLLVLRLASCIWCTRRDNKGTLRACCLACGHGQCTRCHTVGSQWQPAEPAALSLEDRMRVCEFICDQPTVITLHEVSEWV